MAIWRRLRIFKKKKQKSKNHSARRRHFDEKVVTSELRDIEKFCDVSSRHISINHFPY